MFLNKNDVDFLKENGFLKKDIKWLCSDFKKI